MANADFSSSGFKHEPTSLVRSQPLSHFEFVDELHVALDVSM